MTTSADLLARFNAFRLNPYAMKRVMLSLSEEITNGEVVIVDATNPLVLLMEATAVNSAAQMSQSETLARRVYPSLAMTPDDLYRHMSDEDYIGRFATPANATIMLFLGVDEIYQKAVPVNDGSGMRKLTIQRHSEIDVGDLVFTMQYPIDIRVMAHGGLSIIYDTDKPSPFYELDTNKVDWDAVTMDNRRWVRIKIPLYQMACNSQTVTLNDVTGFSKVFTFSDMFYHCRAFLKNVSDAGWTEIKTTHTEQVYDPLDPTVVLKVQDGMLGVNVPQVYFTNGLVRDSLRLDIYTTKGPVETLLSNFNPSSYVVKWLDRDDTSGAVFAAPIHSFSDITIASSDAVSGGATELSFTELRDKVVSNALSSPLIPLSGGRLTTALRNLGFGMVTNVDNITSREFLATRDAPAPSNGATLSGAGMTIATLQRKMTDLAALPTVNDNGLRITIRPSTVYNNVGGILNIVPNGTVVDLKNPLVTTPENAALAINQNSYLYSPFYYVYDANNNEFNARAYHLDSPDVTRKFFYADNAPAGIEVAVDQVAIEARPDGTGYNVYIAVLNAAASLLALDLNQIHVQLSYVPPGSVVRQHINGTLISNIDTDTGRPVDGNYVFQFTLNTNYDITDKHELILTPNDTPMALTTEFDLTFIVENYLPASATYSDIDAIVNAAILPGYDAGHTYLGVTQEKITLKFGDNLEHLWRRSRTVPGNEIYLRYSSNVYSYYPDNVYLVDSGTGNIAVTYVTGVGLVYTTLHMKGDPILVSGGTTLTTTEAAAVDDVNINFTAAAFTSGDVGKAFTLWGAGAGGHSLVGTITAVLSPTEVTLSDAVVTAVADGATFIYGTHQLLHAVGDLIMGEDGQPQIVDGTRGLVRHVDLFLIDGKYTFATEQTTTDYRNELIKLLLKWITEDLEGISKRLLEQTLIFFYPRSSIGEIQVRNGDGSIGQIPAEQRLHVRYYMTADRYANTDLRDRITETTIATLADALKLGTVSRTLLEQKLLLMAGDDALSVDLEGFVGGGSGTFTVLDDSNQPSIGKRLVVQTNRTLKLTDSVDVEFVRHN